MVVECFYCITLNLCSDFVVLTLMCGGLYGL